MKILALDLGTRTGWAYHHDDGKLTSGVKEFKLKRGDSPGIRFYLFKQWLYHMIIDRPDVVIYEMPHHRGGHATELLVGFSTRVQELCAIHNIEYKGVHTATLKKFATGNGRSSKKEMVESANKQFCPAKPITDDNEADALWLLSYAMEKFTPSPFDRPV